MDDAARGNRGRLAASWTQILVLLGSGVILLPGLCFAVGNSSHGYNALPAILVLTFGAVVCTLAGGVLFVVRIIREVRRRL